MPAFLAPLHKDGLKFVALFAIAAVILYLIYKPLGLIGFAMTGWCAYFFRMPNRVTPTKEGAIIAPADGIVSLITEVVPPVEYNIGSEKRLRVSIFLNVFDVHVQRIPLAGTVETIIYHPGKFVNAALDKASEDNERQTVIVKSKVKGKEIKLAFTQIAGLIARRILCEIKEGQSVDVGQLYGLIRFGSRVDVYLPAGVKPNVLIGQRMIGGETIMAEL
jgi:phosphatidylserine decarboxylase